MCPTWDFVRWHGVWDLICFIDYCLLVLIWLVVVILVDYWSVLSNADHHCGHIVLTLVSGVHFYWTTGHWVLTIAGHHCGHIVLILSWLVLPILLDYWSLSTDHSWPPLWTHSIDTLLVSAAHFIGLLVTEYWPMLTTIVDTYLVKYIN